MVSIKDTIPLAALYPGGIKSRGKQRIEDCLEPNEKY